MPNPEARVDITAQKSSQWDRVLEESRRGLLSLIPADVGSAVQSFVALLRTAISSAREESEAVNRIRSSLRSSGEEYRNATAALSRYANAVSRLTGARRSEALSGMAAAAAAGLNAEQIRVASQIAVAATARGYSLAEGFSAATEAFRNQEGPLKAIFVEYTNVSGAVNVLSNVQARLPSLMAAATERTKGLAGGLDGAERAIQGAYRTIGESLAPAVVVLANALSRAVESIVSASGGAENLGKVVEYLATPLRIAVASIENLGRAGRALASVGYAIYESISGAFSLLVASVDVSVNQLKAKLQLLIDGFNSVAARVSENFRIDVDLGADVERATQKFESRLRQLKNSVGNELSAISQLAKESFRATADAASSDRNSRRDSNRELEKAGELARVNLGIQLAKNAAVRAELTDLASVARQLNLQVLRASNASFSTGSDAARAVSGESLARSAAGISSPASSDPSTVSLLERIARATETHAEVSRLKTTTPGR